MDKIEELLTRGVANIIPSKEELEKGLRGGKKLNIYLGIDPTTTKIHLGHAVTLRKLQAFAELEHHVTFLIGDFTALIGDTSDKEAERIALTSEQIDQNFKTYKKQAEKFLDFNQVKLRYNSEWLKELNFIKIVELCQHFSAGDFVGRELIRKRLNEGKRVGLHELLYPVMQGYDSFYMDTDLQVGGTDQTFNMQAGRTLQKDLRSKESFIIATEFLLGTDGRKMSKTWRNAIWLEDSPSDIYAKVMAVRDDLIIQYYTLGTNVSLQEIHEIEENLNAEGDVMAIKKTLAHKIVTELHNKKAADQAQDYFEKTVQQKEAPTNIQVYLYTGEKEKNISDLLVEIGLTSSRSEAKRLIEQGGIEIDEKRIENTSQQIEIKNRMIIKAGKRKFVKIKLPIDK